MIQRTVTGLCLTALLAFSLWMGGWVFSSLFMLFLCAAMYEMLKAIKQAGHRIVEWPCWLCLAASLVLFNVQGSAMTGSVTYLMPLMAGTFFLISVMIIFRAGPALEDALLSAMPLAAVALPGMCMLGLQNAPERSLQLLLTLLAFGVPLAGDTLAYCVGSRLGKRKLCPEVSPHKSIEGAIAGLVGSILFAMLCAGIVSVFAPIPPFWHFPILGLVGGMAGQMGDLFASLVKRSCGIKDFSNIFPGHGGVMDRLDSVLWATVVFYIYLNICPIAQAAEAAAGI